MSKLQELIDRLCPDGVPSRKLTDVTIVQYGYPFNSKEFTDDASYIPLIRIRDVKPAIASTYYTGDYPSEYIIHKGDILVGMDGNFNLEKWNDRDGLLNQRVCKIYSKDEMVVSNGFLYHLLGPIFKSIEDELHSGTVIHLSAARINKISIPVPPIEVQEEIVKILDRFADYAAELQAELQARKEQYEYYRNLLLTFNPSAYGCGTDGEQKMNDVTIWGGHSYKIAWKPMGEIGTFIRGKRFVRTDIVDSGTPCIHYGDMYTHYGLYADKTPGFINDVARKMRYAHKNDVVIVAAGENKDDLGNALAWLGEEPAAVHDACFIFKSEMYPNFVSHVCRTLKYHKQVRRFANEAKICSVSGTDLAKVIIPVPEYELQVKIASILDRFETLVNDLTNGLPAEIATVKEQYEYYRNKLLTFNEKSA